MESPRFPDFHLDLLVKRNFDGYWKGVDFKFKGITYVQLKKNSYRQGFKELNFKGLLKKMENKNRVFFLNLCQGQVNYMDPQKAPCL